MSGTDEPKPGADPFGPPVVPTLVGCLHCGQEYDSYRIEWRIGTTASGKPWGFWACPIEGCDGKGFGFDILPVDPNYRDEHGGWIHDDEDEDEAFEDEFDDDFDEPDSGSERDSSGDSIPW
jgi:hypothetical protein